MIPELSTIRTARNGRHFILVIASKAQAKFFRTVARFISQAVVEAAQAAYATSMATLAALEEFVRCGRHVKFYSGEWPMISRDRAERNSEAFFGTPRLVRGDL